MAGRGGYGLLATVVVMGFLLLIPGSVIHKKPSQVNYDGPLMRKLKQVEAFTIDNTLHRSQGSIDFTTNKRRIPDGPDPIHNKKKKNSKQPPGQD